VKLRIEKQGGVEGEVCEGTCRTRRFLHTYYGGKVILICSILDVDYY
jgi:hypothetical protein